MHCSYAQMLTWLDNMQELMLCPTFVGTGTAISAEESVQD